MNEVNFNNISQEDLQYFRNRYIEIFSRVKEKIDSEKAKFEVQVGKQKVTDIKLSPFGKIALLAKKIFVNTAISQVTGIDPVFLDNDTEFLRNSDYQNEAYLRRCNIKKLIYMVFVDVQNGINELLNRLNDNEKYKDVIIRIDDFYRKFYNQNYHNGKKNQSFDGMLYELLISSGVLERSDFIKVFTMKKRGVNIGMTVDFPQDIYGLYDEYKNNNSKRNVR